MSGLAEKGQQFLDRTRARRGLVTVTYVRGALSCTVTAEVGETVFEQQDETGGLIRTETRDYLIRAADLVLDGVEATPAGGDRLQELLGDADRLFEVLAAGTAPAWQWHDRHQTVRRIHTKAVGTA